MPRARPERDRRRPAPPKRAAALGEFDLIDRYFQRPSRQTRVGVGDDAAIVRTTPGTELHVCTDTLVADRHFPAQTPAASVGHRALAVNLSDLAAMAARPRWATLALTLPDVDTHWLGDFAGGLYRLAAEHDVDVVGGDTTGGPLTVTLTLLGEAPRGTRLTRDRAQVGDRVYVSGPLGDAAAGLALVQRQGGATTLAEQHLVNRFLWPKPRLDLTEVLRQFGRAAIDISDGLLADAEHVASASGVRLVIDAARVPVSRELAASQIRESQQQLALAGGDDLELLLTAAPEAEPILLGYGLIRIGEVVAGKGIELHDEGTPRPLPERLGYRHF